MIAAADMTVDAVRIAMHNVKEVTFEQFHQLGQTTLESSDIAYTFELSTHGKPDAWNRPRAMRTQLFFDNAANLQDFLSGMKNQIDELRSELYASMDVRDDETSVDTP